MCCIFPVLKPLACRQTITVPALDLYKLLRGRKFSVKLSPSFCRTFTEKTFKFTKQTPVYKLPQGTIYKPPCVQLINNPF